MPTSPTALAIPTLRHGRVYRSLDVSPLGPDGTGRIDLVNPGLVRRDGRHRPRPLLELEATDLAAAVRAAGRRFTDAALPVDLDGGPALGPDEHLALVADSTGLTRWLCREQLDLIRSSLEALADLVPATPPATVDALAVVLPSNAPAVNRVWLPALALRSSVALKPGSADPFTPARLVAALVAAGLPREAFGFYPTSHAGADALLEAWPRALLFGDRMVAEKYADDAHVAVHGPGHSKVIVADPGWRDHVDLLAAAVVDVGGRSCLNASTLVVPDDADACAEAVAEALLATPSEALAGFSDRARAEAISGAVDAALAPGGAEDVSARLRGTPRVAAREDQHVLLPTIVRCDDLAHPLAQQEYLFPFAAVVAVPPDDLIGWLHPTLGATVVGADEALLDALRASGKIDRLTVGSTPPTRGSSMALHLERIGRLLS